jgi:hypothetical protein
MLSDWLVDRQIFRQADYQRALKSFREIISSQSEAAAIFDTGKELVKTTLRIADAAVRANNSPETHSANVAWPFRRGLVARPFLTRRSISYVKSVSLSDAASNQWTAKKRILKGPGARPS